MHMTYNASFPALITATCLHASAAFSLDINTPTTIYDGGDLGNTILYLNSSLTYGTVGVVDYLDGILWLENGAGTLAVADGSTLNVSNVMMYLDYDLTLGTATDTGTIIINGGGTPYIPYSHPNPSSIRVAGGTVQTPYSEYFYIVRATTIDADATVRLTSGGNVTGLKGDGLLDANGRNLTIRGAAFNGVIENVNELLFSASTEWSDLSSPVLGGRLRNVGSIRVNSGVQLQIATSMTAGDLADIGSIVVASGGVFDLGANDATLNGIRGAGLIGTTGALTINGGDFDGNLDANGTITFTGTTRWSGVLDDASDIIISAGSELITDSATVFTGATPMTVAGRYTVQADASVGSLTGAGTVAIDSGRLTVGSGNTSSVFDGTISGSGVLAKTGSGTLTLASSAALHADSVVQAGAMVLETDDISGDISNNASVIFDLAGGAYYAGSLSGSGSFTKLGAGILTLSGTNLFSGTFNVFAGGLLTDAIGLQGNVLNDALVTFDQALAGSYAATMSGNGALVKTGAGRLNWTGTGTFTGGTEVEEGLLSVNGSLAGLVTVDDGAELGGSGSVGALSALTGARIAPGNSIGTLSVAGNADFAAGTTYAVEVDGLGNADLLDVGGVLTVSSDAVVTVNPENGIDTGIDYATPITYTIASAAGGVSGTFGSVSDSFAFLDSSLTYDANSIYLTLTRLSFATNPDNSNEAEVGEAVDGLPNGPVPNALLTVTDSEQSNALRDLSGEIHASVVQGLADAAGSRRDGVLSEISASGRRGYWSIVSGSAGRFEADGVASGGSMLSGGALFGADIMTRDGVTLGVMAGYDHSAMDLDDRESGADIDSVSVGAYGMIEEGPVAVRLGGLYAWHAIDTARDVAIASLDERLTADYHGATVQGFAEASYAVDASAVTLEPYLGAALVYGSQTDLAETGGAAALSGGAEALLSAYGMTGLRVRHRLTLGERLVSLEGALGFEHLLDGDRSAASLAFDESADFRVQGKAAARNSGTLKVGLATEIAAGAELSMSYDARFAEGDYQQALKAGLRLSF